MLKHDFAARNSLIIDKVIRYSSRDRNASLNPGMRKDQDFFPRTHTPNIHDPMSNRLADMVNLLWICKTRVRLRMLLQINRTSCYWMSDEVGLFCQRKSYNWSTKRPLRAA